MSLPAILLLQKALEDQRRAIERANNVVKNTHKESSNNSQRRDRNIKDRNVLIMSTENFDKFEKALSNETIEENKCLQKFLNQEPNWRK